MSNTSRFIRPLLEFLFPAAPEATLALYHGLIRKLAHLTEYAILAAFAFRAFKGSARTLLSGNPYIFAFIAALFVAAIDESTQSFNPSRTGSVFDAAIDLSGAAAALLLIALNRGRHKIDKTKRLNL